MIDTDHRAQTHAILDTLPCFDEENESPAELLRKDRLLPAELELRVPNASLQ